MPAFEAYLNAEKSTARRFKQAFDYLWRNEETLHPVLDVPMFVGILTNRTTELQQWFDQQGSA